MSSPRLGTRNVLILRREAALVNGGLGGSWIV
jgi:hypothetical protein